MWTINHEYFYFYFKFAASGSLFFSALENSLFILILFVNIYCALYTLPKNLKVQDPKIVNCLIFGMRHFWAICWIGCSYCWLRSSRKCHFHKLGLSLSLSSLGGWSCSKLPFESWVLPDNFPACKYKVETLCFANCFALYVRSSLCFHFRSIISWSRIFRKFVKSTLCSVMLKLYEFRNFQIIACLEHKRQFLFFGTVVCTSYCYPIMREAC